MPKGKKTKVLLMVSSQVDNTVKCFHKVSYKQILNFELTFSFVCQTKNPIIIFNFWRKEKKCRILAWLS